MIIWARRQMHFHFDSEPGYIYFPDNVQPPLWRLNLRMCLRKTHRNISQMLTMYITAGLICSENLSLWTWQSHMPQYVLSSVKKRGLGLFQQQKCYEYNILTNCLLNFYIFSICIHLGYVIYSYSSKSKRHTIVKNMLKAYPSLSA